MDFYDFLQHKGRPLKKSKGTYIFRQGQGNQALYFVKTGLLKGYYSDVNGKEFIKSFLLSGDIIGSLTAAYTQQNCSFSLKCLEDTDLIEISFETLYNQSLHDPEMANTMIDLLLKFAMKKEQREYELLCLSAEQRYCKMRKNASDLLERITQYDLAQYLGVTPVGLSRIKKRVDNA